MSNLHKSAEVFYNMLNKKYIMKLSHKKNIIEIILDFKMEDYFHLVGLQYLTDIKFNKSYRQVFRQVLNGEITDDFLRKSAFYRQVENNYVIVEERIKAFQKIELLLDSESIIFKYIKNYNKYSKIDADYLIEVKISDKTYYIFMRKRKNSVTYKLCSFFEKQSEYYGEKAYWLYKEKIDTITKDRKILFDCLES